MNRNIRVENGSNGIHLGKLSTNEFDSDSIYNEFGSYGSKFSSTLIWNEFSEYEIEFSSKSAFNELKVKYKLKP